MDVAVLGALYVSAFAAAVFLFGLAYAWLSESDSNSDPTQGMLDFPDPGLVARYQDLMKELRRTAGRTVGSSR